MDAELKVEGVGIVEVPVIPQEDEGIPTPVVSDPTPNISYRSGFDTTKVGDPRRDIDEDEGGIIAPTKRVEQSEGAVMLTGFKATYHVGDETVGMDVRQMFDTVDDAKASIINAKSCYAMTPKGLKLSTISYGAPRISEGDKESWIYIEGGWKRL